MEIVIRLQRYVRQHKLPHKIVYLPDPVAWTEAPETCKELSKQRLRWNIGLLETLWHHKTLFFNPKFGFYGLFVYPFWLLGEAMEPLIEIASIFYVFYSYLTHTLHVEFFLILLLVSFGFNFLFTLFCLLIEDLTFKRYASWRSLFLLILFSFLENFGYRQFTLFWRLCAFFHLRKITKIAIPSQT